MKPSELPYLKRAIYRLFGRVRIDIRVTNNEGATSQFYLEKCPIHGPYESPLHKWREELRCPECYEMVKL